MAVEALPRPAPPARPAARTATAADGGPSAPVAGKRLRVRDGGGGRRASDGVVAPPVSGAGPLGRRQARPGGVSSDPELNPRHVVPFRHLEATRSRPRRRPGSSPRAGHATAWPRHARRGRRVGRSRTGGRRRRLRPRIPSGRRPGRRAFRGRRRPGSAAAVRRSRRRGDASTPRQRRAHLVRARCPDGNHPRRAGGEPDRSRAACGGSRVREVYAARSVARRPQPPSRLSTRYFR